MSAPMLPDIARDSWRPSIEGWSEDILPYYEDLVPRLPFGAVVVEIGVAHGRSAVFFAEQLHRHDRSDVELWCVDAWDGDWFRRSIVPTLARPELAPYVDRMRIVRCDSVRAANLFDDRSVDVVFIDSDHTKQGVQRQLPAWARKVRDGGILAGHDYSLADWPGVVSAVDEYFASAVLVEHGVIDRPTRTVWQYRFPLKGVLR